MSALALGGLLAGCGSDDEGSAAPTSDEVQAALDAAVEAGAPGIALEIRGPAGDEFLTSGYAAVESQEAIDPGERFRIASVTKSFTATVVMQLVAEDEIALGDTVSELAPGLLAAGGEITVGQLLGHTSGLPEYTKTDAFAERAGAGKSLTPEQVLGFVADDEPEFEPGSQYAYSDSDNIALGLIIEEVTGNSFESELNARVIEPLGLEQTELATSFDFPEPHAQGYQYDPDSGELEDVTDARIDPNGAWASGALISTPADVSSFFAALLGGEVVPPEQLEEMIETVPGAGSPAGPGTNNAGLGIFGWEISCGEVWGHTGSWPGFRSLGAASEDGEGSISMVVNATDLPDEAQEAVLDAQELAACRALGRPAG
ncbi:MAG: serine hydrolase domain-containing protein [bacterium]